MFHSRIIAAEPKRAGLTAADLADHAAFVEADRMRCPKYRASKERAARNRAALIALGVLAA